MTLLDRGVVDEAGSRTALRPARGDQARLFAWPCAGHERLDAFPAALDTSRPFPTVALMPAIAFDRFYRYDELTELVQGFAREFPDLVSVASIGKSHEGRDIWVASITNTKTGPAADKPAFWVDGNIHATEVAASAANLYFLHVLTSQYGVDADMTRALDTRAFYVCPRINPDGAEWALADRPRWIRSSTRPYPFDEEALDGLVVEDIDGDGRILQMRIPDPNGLWKAHATSRG